MIIEPEKRSDFEARVRELLRFEQWTPREAFYDDEEKIQKLADAVGWDKQSPVEEKE